MKATFKTLAILLMAAAGFAACGDDDNNDNGNLKEYALQVRVYLNPNDSTVETQLQKTIEAAMNTIGISEKEPYIYLAARDSADAAPKVQEIGKKLETVLNKNARQMYGKVYIMATEKQLSESSNGKKHSWSRWYDVDYPKAENEIDYKVDTTLDPWNHNNYFIYNLEISNEAHFWTPKPKCFLFNEGDKDGNCFQFVDPEDLNDCAGGTYLHLVMRAVSNANHPVYGKQLITDVVMINTGGDSNYPDSVYITKDGKRRCYYPVFTEDKGANGSTCHDLNNGAGGPYLWMYYTTDYRDGWVLANRSDKADGDVVSTCIRIRFWKSTDSHYMRAYKKNAKGEWVDYGCADMNEDAGGTNVYLSLGFRKVQ